MTDHAVPPAAADDFSFECPHCGGEVETRGESSALLHAMPPCQKFVDMEPDEYLMSVNDALAAENGHTADLARVRAASDAEFVSAGGTLPEIPRCQRAGCTRRAAYRGAQYCGAVCSELRTTRKVAGGDS